jgi:hypothetical protein
MAALSTAIAEVGLAFGAWRFLRVQRTGLQREEARDGSAAAAPRRPDTPHVPLAGHWAVVGLYTRAPRALCTGRGLPRRAPTCTGVHHRSSQISTMRQSHKWTYWLSLSSLLRAGLCAGRFRGGGPGRVLGRPFAIQLAVAMRYATRSRAPNGAQRNQHSAGYRSRICLNKRRNTNLARETRTLCPVGRTALRPWVCHQRYWLRCYRSPRETPHRCARAFVEYHTSAPYKKPRMRCPTARALSWRRIRKRRHKNLMDRGTNETPGSESKGGRQKLPPPRAAIQNQYELPWSGSSA